MKRAHSWALLLSAALLLSLHASAAAVPLSDLLGGQSITVEDKEFFNFRNFQSNASGGAVPVDPAQIDVTPAFFGDEIGLQFTDNPNMRQWSLQGANLGQGSVFDFDVMSNGPFIVDNTLQFTPVLTGAPGPPPTRAVVEEQVFGDLNQQNSLAFKQVLAEVAGPVNLMDHAVFGADQLISVNVDIGLITGNDPGSLSQIDDFTLTFSQLDAIPEPAGIAIWSLLGLVASGLGLHRRRPKDS